jgi:hypothetical protein
MATRFCMFGLLLVAATLAAQEPPPTVTFNKDVLPILQKNCQSCHRPGQIAPMSFLTYADARPYARAMQTAVTSRKMPPWFADRGDVHYLNERVLSSSDINTIARWVLDGAIEGDPKDAPRPIEWPADGWDIPPDIVVNGPEFRVPAHTKNDVVEWTYLTVPSGITRDTWITSLEIRPSQPAVTHHICVYFRPHTPDVAYGVPVWQDRPRDESGNVLATAAGTGARDPSITAGATAGGCYVPGRASEDYRIYAAAKLIKADTDLVFQVHYTPNGKEVTDRPRVGFTVLKEAPRRRYVYASIDAPSDAQRFAIPPNNPNWESPTAEAVFDEDAELVWISPHMHVRGKDVTYRLVYADGRIQTVLSVGRYDFNWQLGYELAKPIRVPKGTRLVVSAHFDNSAGNRFNPDPNRTIYYGEMSWDEMMKAFFSIVVDINVDPAKIIRRVPDSSASSGGLP